MPVNDVLRAVNEETKADTAPPAAPTADNAPDPESEKEIPRDRPMNTARGLPPYIHSRDLRIDKETALDIVAAVSSVAGIL